MKNPRLIDKAATGHVRKRQTKHPEDQLVELAVHWLGGRIGTADLCVALGKKPTSGSGAIATVMQAMRRAIVAGKKRFA